MSYRVEWRSHAKDISDTLWSLCFPPPYEGLWWYEALEQSGLEDQFTFLYAIVFKNGNPVAIAPCFVMDVPIRQVVPETLMPLFTLLGRIIPSLMTQRTFFVGSPCADEGRVGILQSTDIDNILSCLQKAMMAKAAEMKAPMFAWKDFPEAYSGSLNELANSDGLFRLVSFPSTVVSIPAEGKNGYLKSLKPDYRRRLMKRLRSSMACIEVVTEVLQSPDVSTLDEIFSLFWQTYNKATTRFERLNRQFFETIARDDKAYFILLRERPHGAMIAFMLCFAFDDYAINKFIGIDYSKPKETFTYFRLWDAAIEWSCSLGIKVLQSGQTGYKAKIETGHRLISLNNYCRHRNPLIHFIYKLFARTVTWSTLDAQLAVYVKAHPELML